MQALVHLSAPRTWVVLSAAALAIGLWAWAYDYPSKALQAAEKAKTGFSSALGQHLDLKLQHVVVVGRQHLKQETVAKAVGAPVGTPLLSVDLDAIRIALESESWVEKAHVTRQWPGTIKITLTERVPVALWQEKGTLTLIDKQGKKLDGRDMGAYSALPVVVGKGAPEHAFTLVSMLAETPALFGKVASAVRVGERRWNIRFYDGLEVMLPEQDAEGAWLKFAKLATEQDIFNRDVTRLDLRQSGRAYVRLVDGKMPEKKPEAAGKAI